MRGMVNSAIEILRDTRAPIREFGELLHQSWVYKRELAATVSNTQIDNIYEAGALRRDCGKLLGAGGGGFMIFVVEPDRREACART